MAWINFGFGSALGEMFAPLFGDPPFVACELGVAVFT